MVHRRMAEDSQRPCKISYDVHDVHDVNDVHEVNDVHDVHDVHDVYDVHEVHDDAMHRWTQCDVNEGGCMPMH